MRSRLILSISRKFISLFACITAAALMTSAQGQDPSLVGSFHGIVGRTGEPASWMNSHLGARLEITVVANRTYTGKLISVGTPLTFSGTITPSDVGAGSSTATISRGSLPALTVQLDFANDEVTGSVENSQDGMNVPLSGWRNVWNASTRPATAYLGRYNFLITTGLEAGMGFGSLTVPANGAVTVSGKLPDGSTFSTDTFVGPQGQVLLYQTLYSKPGSIIGVLGLTPSTPDAPSTLGFLQSVSWFKPDMTSTAERFYAGGFLTDCTISGQVYNPPVPGDIAAGLYDVGTNGRITFNGEATNSATVPETYFTLNSAGKVTMASATDNPAKTTVAVKVATGEYSGSMTLVDYDFSKELGTDRFGNPIYKKITRNVKFEGLIVNNNIEAANGGFYLVPGMPDSQASPPVTLTNSQMFGGAASIIPNPDAPPAQIFGLDSASAYAMEGEPSMMSVIAPDIVQEDKQMTIQVIPGTAVAADLSATKITITIKAGSSSAAFLLPIKDDGLDEEPETFRLVLSDGPGYDIADPAFCEVTIEDDDYPSLIVSGPVHQILPLGSSASLMAEVEGSDLLFQWQKNNANLTGANSNPLLLSNLQLSQAGLYRLKISNAINDGTSANAELAVVDTGLRLLALASGGTATLSAIVGAPAGTVTYQWLVSGSEVEDDTGPSPRISGATTATLTIKNLSEADIGDYVCIVTQPSSGGQISTGEYRLRLPTLAPDVADIILPDGQIMRPYFYEVLYATEYESAPASFSATGLPAGLSINPNTGVISGIPTSPVANAAVTISATNPVGTTSIATTITINPYPSGALGTFNGIVDRAPVTEAGYSPFPKAELGARIEVQTTNTGGFSGKLLNGSSFPFSGQLSMDENGLLHGTTMVQLSGKNSPPAYLTLTFHPEDQSFSGTLSEYLDGVTMGMGLNMQLRGWRNAWTKTAPSTPYLGRFNFTLGSQSGDPNLIPEGSGYGTFVVPPSGTFNVTGVMPDGTAFICNTFLGPDGQVLLFQPIFKTPGSLHGAVQVILPEMTGPPTETVVLTPSVMTLRATDSVPQELTCTWNKPLQANAKEKLYRQGFPVSSLTVDGGLYTPPEAGAIVMDLPDVNLNAQLAFSSSAAGSEFIPQSLTINSSGKATVPTGSEANPMKVTFTVNASTGLFNGTFTKKDEDPSRPPVYSETTGRLIRAQGYFTRSARFYGIIINSAAIGGGLPAWIGHGLFTLPQMPNAEVEPPVTATNAQTISGRITLMQNPDAQPPLIVQLGDGGAVALGESNQVAPTTMQLPIRLSEPQTTRRTFSLSLQHVTSTASDLTLSSTSVVFEPGVTETYVMLTGIDDNLDEEDELLYLKLSDGPGYNVSPSKLPIVIIDDDTAVSFARQPLSSLLATSTSLSLAVEASGSQPLSYQWRRDGVNIPGAITPEFYIDAVKLSDGGRYDVVVTNRVGSITSNPSNVSVMDNAERYIPFADGTNTTLPLSINAPAGAVTFRWLRLPTMSFISDNSRITGSSTKTLKINNATVDDEGTYACMVTKPAVYGLVDGLLQEIEPPLEFTSPAFYLVIVTEPPQLIDIPPLTTPPDSGAVGRPFAYQVNYSTDTYSRPASFSATGLPAGLTIDVVTGLISGTPTAAVSNRSITITATNAAGSDSVTTTLTIEALPSYAVGTFHGFVDRHMGMQISDAPVEYQHPWEDSELGALMELTTTAGGVFSGKLIYGANTHNFSGSLLNQEGTQLMGQAYIQRTGKQTLFLIFGIDEATQSLQGSLDISNVGINPVTLIAWRQTWSSSKQATAYAGSYTFAIIGDGASARSPGGTGYATCTVPLNGAPFEVKGRLPDGTAFASSTQLGPRGEFLIYQGLYARPGSAMGLLRLGAEPDATAGQPVYVENMGYSSLYKPYQTASSETIYTDGIGPITLSFDGGRSVPAPAAGEVVIDLPNVADNAMINFVGANIEASETPPNTVFRIQTSGSTTMKTGEENPAKVSVTIKPATSEFSGSLTLKDLNPLNGITQITRNVTFQGVFIELSGGSKVGRGYFTLKQLPEPGVTTVTTAPSFTGTVELAPGPGVGF